MARAMRGAVSILRRILRHVFATLETSALTPAVGSNYRALPPRLRITVGYIIK
jgi:hypothetical protein